MNRAQVLRARRRRRRIVLSIAFVLALGVLVTAGVGVGAGVGFAAGLVRELGIFPEAAESLPSAKVVPPAPVDISGPAQACTASSLTVMVLAERAALNPGEGTNLHVTVTNSGRYPCLVNGGLENLRIRLVDANQKVVWAAEHCGLEGSRELLMGPGNQTAWDFYWDGHGSAAGTCTEGQSGLKPGNWEFIASLAEVAHSDSAPAVIYIRDTAK